jgi:hypothetical protein
MIVAGVGFLTILALSVLASHFFCTSQQQTADDKFEDRLPELRRLVEQQEQESAAAVANYAPETTAHLDDLNTSADGILRQLPGVVHVEVRVRAEKPTHRIVHLRDWHYVPKDLYGIDLRNSVHWNTQKSGILIHPDVARHLEALWERHVGAIRGGNTPDPLDGEDPEAEEFPEGRVLYRLHCFHERCGDLPRRAKELALKKNGGLTCVVCGFDFHATLRAGRRGLHRVPPHRARLRVDGRDEDKASGCRAGLLQLPPDAAPKEAVAGGQGVESLAQEMSKRNGNVGLRDSPILGGPFNSSPGTRSALGGRWTVATR